MNKIYNIVWNESSGMWVVTSELTRKGGQRHRKIKKTMLAGLIAGLMLPAIPAMAQMYNDKTLEYSDSVMELSAGDTATNTTINGGAQYISSGGNATSTTINEGVQIVFDGGTALMNPLMILVKIIKLRWIHILSYDQMVSRKINNQTTRCANSIFYTTLFTNSAPNY
ncbi:hypothetical protein ZZ70_22800, partial [Salmonella enterica subsp. enterica serovar Typhimurium]|nr:hypothetical protein [Salmonella enterica subsp. enterica serovar Typhimurium]